MRVKNVIIISARNQYVCVMLFERFRLFLQMGLKYVSKVGYFSRGWPEHSLFNGYFVTLRPLAPTHVNFLLTMLDQLVAEGVTHISLPLQEYDRGDRRK